MSYVGRVIALGVVLTLPWGGLVWPGAGDLLPGAAMADDDDDDGPSRPRPAVRDDDDDDGPSRPRPSSRDDDDDDAPAPRPSATRDDDDDDGPAPRPSATRDDDDDDGPGARQTTRDDDDDDDDGPTRAPATRESDDDDDDGPSRSREDDDDDDGGARAPAPRPAAPPPPPPERVVREQRSEVVALDLSAEDVAALEAQGYRVIEEKTIPQLGTQTRRLLAPAGVTDDAAREAVRALPSGGDADFNHFYRSEQEVVPASAPGEVPGWGQPCDGLHCPAFDQIAWPVEPSRDLVCGTAPVAIGMIDTGLNADHTTFAGATLELTRLSDATLDPSRAVHGTAVAAILVGSPESRSPGLVPWARLVAVDAFHRAGQDERADVVALIEGLGFLADQGVQVVNLSLTGPPNTVLEEAIARLVNEEGIVIVAAAGNGGPRAEPAYPAAYDGVIAVTAMDGRDGVYRRAQQGDYVDLAAPGVEVWTAASVSGARSKTGTSFAVPFVTAAAALVMQGNPALTPAEVEAVLAAGARDLGDPGRDPVYGHGAVMAAELCTVAVEVPPLLAEEEDEPAPGDGTGDVRPAGEAAAVVEPGDAVRPAGEEGLSGEEASQ